MPKFLFVILLFIQVIGYTQNQGLVQQSRVDPKNLSSNTNQKYSSTWGYIDSFNNKYYAFLGGTDSIYIIDVTIPENPQILFRLKTRHSRTFHREFRTYKNYLFTIGREGNSLLQVYNLAFLPDSIPLVSQDSTLSISAQDLWIENNKLYLCDNLSYDYENQQIKDLTLKPLEIFDISNPSKPKKILSLKPPRIGNKELFSNVHFIYVKNDTAFLSAGNDGLYIYDFSDMSTPTLITYISNYNRGGYNHSSVLSADLKYLIFSDENAGNSLKIFNIEAIKDSPPSFEYTSELAFEAEKGSKPHFSYQVNDTLYIAYYHSGVVVFDINDKDNPKFLNRFLTNPELVNSNYYGFKGCWNVYPYLGNERILASDMSNGLYVLRWDKVNNIINENFKMEFSIFPNPAKNRFTINWNNLSNSVKQLSIYSTEGKLVYESTIKDGLSTIEIFLEAPKGIYFINIRDNKNFYSEKLIIN